MKIKITFILLILITIFSCNKDYNTIGTDILKSDTFDTNIELVPVYATQKFVPPFKSNNLDSYQLGQINDNIFGKSEASFVTQLNLSEFNPIFGKWDTEKEIKGNPDNVAVIKENELITVTIDLHSMGLAFLKNGIEKQHFLLNF